MTFPELVLVLLIGALGYFIGKLVEATSSDHEGAICPPVYPWSPYCHDQPIMKIWKGPTETHPSIQKTKEDVIMKTKVKEALAGLVIKQLRDTRENNCNKCIFYTCENCKLDKSMADLVKEAILFDGDVEITVKAKGIGEFAKSEEQ
jgi:hypothetical protein